MTGALSAIRSATTTCWLCRRCATVFSAPSLTPLDPEPELQRRLTSPAEFELLTVLTVHDCGHGGFGIADLVGAVPEVRT